MTRRMRTVILALVLIAAVAAICGYSYYHSMLSRIQHEEGYYYPASTDYEDEVTGLEVGLEDIDASSLDEYLRMWATNDIEPLRDRNVLNIVLCGVDSRSGEARGGRSDAMMLVSINKRRHTVTLVSILRDSYSFIDLTRDPARPRTTTDRINAAYSLGGPATLLETLEHNYKIQMDDYVSVDFNSFPKLVNALGGVRVDVTAQEAAYINRTAPSQKGNFPAGKGVKLSGAQALLYSRIRKLDSDLDRTDRQQKIIMAIIASARQASAAQILRAVSAGADFARTGFTRQEIDSMVKEALAQDWLKYDFSQTHSPTVPGDKEAEGNPSAFSTYITGRWLWIVDYPRDARRLQERLYGVTNIRLAADREDVLAGLFRQAKKKQSSAPKTTTKKADTTQAPEESTTLPADDFTEFEPTATEVITQSTEPEKTTENMTIIPEYSEEEQ